MASRVRSLIFAWTDGRFIQAVTLTDWVARTAGSDQRANAFAVGAPSYVRLSFHVKLPPTPSAADASYTARSRRRRPKCASYSTKTGRLSSASWNKQLRHVRPRSTGTRDGSDATPKAALRQPFQPRNANKRVVER